MISVCHSICSPFEFVTAKYYLKFIIIFLYIAYISFDCYNQSMGTTITVGG